MALNTAENRGALMRYAHASGCPAMTPAIAGGFLLYDAMPEGVRKAQVFRLAHRLAATYPWMEASGGVLCLGAAYLTTVSLPVSRRWADEVDSDDEPESA